MLCHGTCTTLCQVRLDNFRDGASLQLQRLPVAARRSERARLRTQNRRRIESIRASERATDCGTRARERWSESGRVSSEQLALKRWTSETNVESKLAIIVHSFVRSFVRSFPRLDFLFGRLSPHCTCTDDSFFISGGAAFGGSERLGSNRARKER